MRVTDELNGQPPRSLISLRAQEKGLIPRIAANGLIGFVAIPSQVFPALRTQSYTVHMTLAVDGYVTRELEATLPIDPTFPDTFSSPFLEVELHRNPVVIFGRTVRGDNGAPLPGATVSISGIWRQTPPFNAPVASSPPNIVHISPFTYRDRAAAPGRLRRNNFNQVAGDDKHLTVDSIAGVNPVRLSNRQNLNPGDVLMIDVDSPDKVELLAINLILGSTSPDEPALITFDHPLLLSHRSGAVVRRTTPAVAGAQNTLSVDAQIGDSCILLNSLTGLGTANEVSLNDGVTPIEYHRVQRFTVTSDADGYYRLPPLARIAQIEIHSERTIGPTTFLADVTYQPDYTASENHLDLVLAA